MTPRFLVRMASQAAMQEKWHEEPNRSDPPPYEQRLSMLPTGELPCEDPLQSTAPANDPPSYQSLQHHGPPPPVYRQHQYSHPVSGIDLHSFPDRSTICVIGACTRQGMHIIDRLLEQNYTVRGVVSNSHESAQTSKHFEFRYDRDRYHSWIIPDMSRRGAFNLAIETCAGVVFVAGQAGPAAVSKVIILARVKNALAAAMREARMDRFVFCSPKPAVAHPSSRSASPVGSEVGDSRSFELSRESLEACGRETNRAEVEVAIWDCVDGRRPGFALDIGEYSSSLAVVFEQKS